MPAQSRDKILRAALGCFSHDGVAATTLSTLRGRSGVSVGSFYHHFASKEQVAAALYIESLAMYQRDFVSELRRHADPRRGVSAIVMFHVGWCVRHRDRARFMFTERPPRRGEQGGTELAVQNKAFYEEVLTWWRPHVHHGALRPVDVTTCYVLWLGPAQELCRLWLSGRAPEPSPAQVALLGEAAWQCLRQPNPLP